MADAVDWPTLKVVCTRCSSPLNGDGTIEVSGDQIRKAKRWDAEHSGIISGASLATMPGPAHWQAWHKFCDPDPQGDPFYWFGADRLQHVGDLIEWTAHLLGKTWLELTDWDSILRRAGHTNEFRCLQLPTSVIRVLLPVEDVEEEPMSTLAKQLFDSISGTSEMAAIEVLPSVAYGHADDVTGRVRLPLLVDPSAAVPIISVVFPSAVCEIEPAHVDDFG